MPLYDYECDECGVLELFHRMGDRPDCCPECGSALTRIYAPVQSMFRDDDFSSENGGRGRYHPSLAKYKGDPYAYITSRRDCEEKAKRQGQSFERV